MTKILLTLGDSWPEGAELGAGRRYGEILKDAMEFDQLLNYGSGGASNEDMLYQLQDYLQKHTADCQVTAVFFLTNPARTAHFPRFLSWDNANAHSKQIYTHFHTSEHEIMRSSATVSALQKWCDAFGIDDYYFAGWVKYAHWLPGVDLDRIWAHGQETAANWFGASDHNGEHLVNVQSNPYIRPNFAHPNQMGHDLIAQKLQNWIQSKQ